MIYYRILNNNLKWYQTEWNWIELSILKEEKLIACMISKISIKNNKIILKIILKYSN